MKKIVFTYALVLLLVLPLSSAGQRPPRNRAAAGQTRTFPDYEELLQRRNELVSREAMLKQQLDEARELFSDDIPAREALGKKIVELENLLFALKAEVDSIDERLLSMEKYGIGVPSEEGLPEPQKCHSAMIVENDYFSQNLPVSDYVALLKAQAQEPEIAQLLRELKENYDRLSVLLSVYYLAQKGEQADSLFSGIERVALENEQLADSIGKLWGTVFDTKIYAYNYILDKQDEKDLLQRQERQMNNLLLLEAEIEGEYMYEEAARYALQKLLVSGYEQRMADLAGLQEAADSLGGLPPTTSHIDDYFLPWLDTRERMFYDFADAQAVKPSQYTSSSQIPAVEIFPRGNMYRILLGTYSKTPPVSTFRNIYPLSHEVKADRRHYYYAGGYRTYSEAQEAAARLKKSGLRNPRVVAWFNGRYEENPARSNSPGSENTKEITKDVHYIVEISGAGNNLSRVVREVIERQAAGKEISRTTDPASGEPVFAVGTFHNKALAETLVNELTAAEPMLCVTVIPIP